MVTTGYIAFRYNGLFYRGYVPGDAYPHSLGQYLATRIPRDPAIRERWIYYVKKRLDARVGARRGGDTQDDWDSSDDEFGGPQDEESGGSSDEERGAVDESPNIASGDLWDESWGDDYEKPGFSEIVKDNLWLTFDFDCDNTFVFDLDHRAFTMDGTAHFNMDNMPPPETNIADYYYDYDTTPLEYRATVSYWPKPALHIDTISRDYDRHTPLIVALADWDAPTWDSLSVSQSLAIDMAKSIVLDFKKILANPSLMINFDKVIILCWRVICAAAPAHLFCPTTASNSFKDILHTSTRMDEYGMIEGEPTITSNDLNTLFFPRLYIEIDYKKPVLPRHYYRFRDCLFKFCMRLDDDLHLKSEVVQMVNQLRKDGQTTGIGIAISSNQLVAVAVDETGVRHSPALEFHDSKGGVQDGLLLLVHLLSPAMTVRKPPWTKAFASSFHNSSATLPEDVIRHILRFADEEAYHFVLPRVSRLVRSICLSQPRVGDYVFTSVNADGLYRALPVFGPTSEINARLVRKQRRAKKNLEYSFLTHQTGTEEGSDEFMTKLGESRYGMKVSWDRLVKGNVLPSLRIVVVDGAWAVEEVLGDA
ncbi:hypothetical protein RhiJN_16461 [Ceratobasidium sp. AG-Ba]|nr:hypothetical protein RhiJN_16461 [Ceratobasidium sp. AG-Ba]